ncbi:MAG: hypothetical protein HW391_316 [Chloroflexi bacterium]|nr:hypothetical protein [Chloroflexota bacterium]
MAPGQWDQRAIPHGLNGSDSWGVEGTSIAHELPELYRAVLERIAVLERTGHRRSAELIRREAIQAYSRAWDDTAFHRIDQLRIRAERLMTGVGQAAASNPAPAAAAAAGGPHPA